MDSPLVQIVNGTVGYKTPLIREVNITLKPGALTLLLGKNGTGKSTLIKTLLGKVKLIDGTLKASEKKIAYVPAKNLLAPNLTVRDVLEFGALGEANIFGNITNAVDQRIVAITKQIEIENWQTLYYDELSTGMQQIVNIARALVQNPDVILLDEPTANLDIENKQRIYSLLKDITKSGKSICCVTHDVHWAHTVADETFVITNDKKMVKVQEEASIEEVVSTMLGKASI